MGCCVDRSKHPDPFGQPEEYRLMNQLPTFENLSLVYSQLQLPKPLDGYCLHKKELMVFMIINLL